MPREPRDTRTRYTRYAVCVMDCAYGTAYSATLASDSPLLTAAPGAADGTHRPLPLRPQQEKNTVALILVETLALAGASHLGFTRGLRHKLSRTPKMHVNCERFVAPVKYQVQQVAPQQQSTSACHTGVPKDPSPPPRLAARSWRLETRPRSAPATHPRGALRSLPDRRRTTGATGGAGRVLPR